VATELKECDFASSKVTDKQVLRKQYTNQHCLDAAGNISINTVESEWPPSSASWITQHWINAWRMCEESSLAVSQHRPSSRRGPVSSHHPAPSNGRGKNCVLSWIPWRYGAYVKASSGTSWYVAVIVSTRRSSGEFMSRSVMPERDLAIGSVSVCLAVCHTLVSTHYVCDFIYTCVLSPVLL